MKTSEAKEKKFRELSEDELQNVTGGTKFTITPITPIAPGGGGSEIGPFSEECKDKQYACAHTQECKMACAGTF